MHFFFIFIFTTPPFFFFVSFFVPHIATYITYILYTSFSLSEIRVCFYPFCQSFEIFSSIVHLLCSEASFSNFLIWVFSLLLPGMANLRKQQGESHNQMGHWRSSSYHRKPPLDNWHSTVPSWEKKFCVSVGSVPWGKLIESKKYMYLHDNVVNWDDSAVKEAFDNAKSRFWAEINGLPCDISLPDPNIHIDNVDWNSSVDPELILDLEREPIGPSDEGRDEEVVILGSSMTSILMDQSFSCTGWGDAEEVTPKPDDLNQSFSPTGWGDAEAEIPKPADPVSADQGWDPNLRENIEVDSWGQYQTPVEHAKEHEWQNRQNDSRGWNERGHYGGNRNWGTWDGYDRKRENMSWSKNSAYHGNEYQMNRGRRNNNRGRRRGNFAYQGSYVDKVPTPTAW